MNSVLDSPLEALAFDYVSFGLITVVNSLWTWVAVLTAAVSFWRLRPRGDGVKFLSPPSNDVFKSSNGCSSYPETSPPITEEEQEPPCSGSDPVAVPSSSAKFEDDGVLTKGVKFTLYFEEDNNGHVGGEGEGDLTAEETENSGGENWWESGLRMRMGDMGWYRYQDLTVLNGNVVRLWDSNDVVGSIETLCSFGRLIN
ncbi:hypothetical protein M0R45_003730 [Rubus argutus]|uniref:Transmembrane protein n=1 Tax=Rubus argutus TaxID=59490 RepID=A0AAW1YHB2_RUBAR